MMHKRKTPETVDSMDPTKKIKRSPTIVDLSAWVIPETPSEPQNKELITNAADRVDMQLTNLNNLNRSMQELHIQALLINVSELTKQFDLMPKPVAQNVADTIDSQIKPFNEMNFSIKEEQRATMGLDGSKKNGQEPEPEATPTNSYRP